MKRMPNFTMRKLAPTYHDRVLARGRIWGGVSFATILNFTLW